MKRKGFPIVFLIAIMVMLNVASCSTNEAQPTQISSAVAPTYTYTPSPTNTPYRTPTPEPLPTADTIGILTAAIEICEGIGLLDPFLPDAATHPVIVLKKTMFEEGAAWELLDIPHQAQKAAEISSLVCIREIRTKEGSYSDGTAAYRLTWDIALVGWPDGSIYGNERLRGGAPPVSKSGSEDVYGSEPIGLLYWLSSTFDDVAFYTGSVRDIDVSPNGGYLARAYGGRMGNIWSITARDDARLIGKDYDHYINAIAFSPSGLTVATGHRDADIGLWDVETGEKLMVFSGHTDEVISIIFSPDGQLLITMAKDNTIKIWSIDTGELSLTMTGHLGDGGVNYLPRVGGIAISPDGSVLASTGRDDTVRVRSIETGEDLFVIEGSRDFAKSIAISPDGRYFVTGGGDNIVRLWDMADGMEIHTMSGHLHSVNSVSFSPNGQTIASGSSDKTVRIWDVASGELISILRGHTKAIVEVAFLPDGQTLVSSSSDHTIRLWNIETE